MFTGIVQGMGGVLEIQSIADGKRISVDLSSLEHESINIGDSVAVNGACLTVVQLNDGVADFEVSKETLSKCLIDNWKIKDLVNLELALTLQTPIGGHLVSGHVDGTATLIEQTNNAEFTAMEFKTNSEIGQFIATKGSITLDGVSLTINKVSDQASFCHFETMLVPHTLNVTSLGSLKKSSRVHVEVDQIARYIHRMMESRK